MILEHISQDDLSDRRVAVGAVLAGKGISFFQLKQYEDAIISLNKVSEYIRPNDQERLRNLVARAHEINSTALVELDRHEEAIAARQRVTEYVRLDDPVDLRQLAAKALNAKGDVLAKLERHEEALAAWERVAEYVRADDPTELRDVAISSLRRKAIILCRTGTVRRINRHFATPLGVCPSGRSDGDNAIRPPKV